MSVTLSSYSKKSLQHKSRNNVTRLGEICPFGTTLKNFGHFESVRLVFGIILS